MLQAQLTANASLNAALLSKGTTKKSSTTTSYLFSPKDANALDSDAVFHLARSAFAAHVAIRRNIQAFEEPLFSQAAKAIDRTRLTVAGNEKLDEVIGRCLLVLSQDLLESSASKLLEWLVRHFRIHEFNVNQVLDAFLPYHETPNFVKMLAILHLDQSSPWNFLLVAKKALTPLYVHDLVTEMAGNQRLARVVTSILQRHLQAHSTHRAVIGFHMSVTANYLGRIKLNDVHLAFILPSLIEGITKTRNKDCVLANILLLASISQQIDLSSEAITTILCSIAEMMAKLEHKQFLLSINSVLGPQENLSKLPEPVLRRLLSIPDLVDTLCSSSLPHLEKLLKPLISSLLERNPTGDELVVLRQLLLSPNLSSELLGHGCSTLVTSVSRERDDGLLQELLSELYQRYPMEVRNAIKENAEENEEDGSIASLSLSKLSLGDTIQDFMIMSTHHEPSARAQGVRGLLSASPMTAEEIGSVKSALTARILDPEAVVLVALYEQPTRLLNLIPADDYTSAIVAVLQSGGLNVDSLEQHVKFLSSLPNGSVDAFELLFPYILASKTTFKHAKVVWMGLSQLSVSVAPELKNLWTDRFQGGKAQKNDMAYFNGELAKNLARHYLDRSRLEEGLSFLIKQLGAPSRASQALGLLVVHSLVSSADGANLLKVANKALNALEDTNLEALESAVGTNVGEALELGQLLRLSASKPGNKSTLRTLKAAVLSILTSVPSRASSPRNWLAADPTEDVHGADIVQFSRRLYKLLNSSASISNPFATSALRTLLLSIGEDCLLFFAGVWSDPAFANLRFVALRHGQAFVQAHVDAQSKRVVKDFQIVWPFVLAVLTEESQEIRDAALCFVNTLNSAMKIDEDNKKATGPDIYRLDALPMEAKSNLKFLEWSDFVKFVATVAAWAEHLNVDATYLTNLLKITLQVQHVDSSKDTKYKRRLLSYLLSYVVAWSNSCPLLSVKVLQEIHDVSDPMKLQVLLPLLDALAKSPSDVLGRLSVNHRESYIAGLLSSFHGKEVGPFVNAESSEEWETFKQLARVGLRDGSTEMPYLLPSVILSVYSVLKQSRRLELCQYLVNISGEADTTTTIREVLARMIEDSSVASSLLAWIRGSANDAAERPAKRARLEREPPSLSALPLICEALVASEVPRPMDILVALLDVLNHTLDGHLEKGEMVFLQCTIMKTIDKLATRVPPQTPGGSQLRFDVLVKLTQDSDTPQAVHQALLLIAALAAMSPLSVLHHVMPILLSTGTHICPRDDAYSSKVVEKTLDSIIPVLVEDLGSKHQTPAALQIAAKPFLNVFVVTAPAIPLHRRRPFFLHLLRAFGPRGFLAPLCVLLLQLPRELGSSGETLMNLALAIAKSEIPDFQLLAYISILSECLQILSNSADVESNFVASSGVESDEAPEDQLQRIGVLLTFVQKGLNRLRASAVDEGLTQQVLNLLLELHQRAPPDPHIINSSVSDAIDDALNLVSVRGMMETTLARITGGDRRLQDGSLQMIAHRLGAATAGARKEISSAIIAVIDFIKDLLGTSPIDDEDRLLMDSALGALATISATALPDELATLSNTVLVVANYLNYDWNTSTGLTTMIVLCKTLGTRVIPDLTKVLSSIGGVIQRSPTDEVKLRDAVGLLNHLLETVPKFWSSADIVSVLTLYGRQNASSPAAHHLQPFAKRLARQIPAETMLAAVKQLWAELKKGDNREQRSERLFIVVREWIKSHQRPQVENATRDLFNMLLEAWDIVTVTPDSSTVRAFVTLTTKLSDLSFRPFYRKMFDWAWGLHAADNSVHRKLAYFTSMTTLLTVLKGLITPYLAPLLDPAMELLDQWSKRRHVDPELWSHMIQFLKLAFEVDEGAFWRDDIIRKLSKPLIRQVCVAASLDDPAAKDAVSSCVSGMAGIVLDEALLKHINLDILMQTRDDEVRTKLYALGCARHIWEDHGKRLAGLQTETLPFVQDCADDAHDEVVREARRLKVTLDRF